MTCELTVSFAGPLVTLQDGGRPGLARFGVPASGPIDPAALAIANAALGNPPGAPAIEVSLGGLQLDCTAGAADFALAGGQFDAALGQTRLAPWTVATLAQGQRLTIRPGPAGSWAVLAFAGAPRANPWLGSLSTHSQSGLGGGALATGARLTLDRPEVRPGRQGGLPLPDWVFPAPRIRVTLGPQDRFFAPEALRGLLTEPFTLTEAHDRMGVRLGGPALPITARLDMPSEPVLKGAIQVAGDGVATVLLADHQTTGGYPKIATVIGPDLPLLAQHRGGDAIRFTAVTPDEAVAATRRAHAALQDYLTALATPRRSLQDRLMAANLISGVHYDP